MLSEAEFTRHNAPPLSWPPGAGILHTELIRVISKTSQFLWRLGLLAYTVCRYKKNWVFSNQKAYCGLKSEGKNLLIKG